MLGSLISTIVWGFIVVVIAATVMNLATGEKGSSKSESKDRDKL